MAALLFGAVTISTDHQDAWILEGLEIPYVAFVTTYIIYVLTEKKITWTIPFALIYRSVILLIPNLKYVWFQGVAIDQHSHYRLAQDIYNEGYIPSGRLYSDTPLMHLSFSVYSTITDIPILYSFKYWPILSWSVYPLAIYVIMKNFGMENESLKYAVIISCIPVKETVSYIVIGTLFGPLLSFLLLSQLVKVLQKRDRRDWVAAIIYSLALVATHSYSSIMFAIALFTTYLMMLYAPSLSKLVSEKFTPLQLTSLLTTWIVIASINMAWISHKAILIFDEVIKTYMIPHMLKLIGTEVFIKEAIPPRFFQANRN